jgi:hypothetical protein
MNHRQAKLFGRDHFARGKSVKSVQVVRPDRGARFKIHPPASRAGQFLRLGEQSLALSVLFREFAVGEIPGYEAEHAGHTFALCQGYQPGDEPTRFAGELSRIFDALRAPRLPNALQHFSNGSVLVPADYILQLLPNKNRHLPV